MPGIIASRRNTVLATFSRNDRLPDTMASEIGNRFSHVISKYNGCAPLVSTQAETYVEYSSPNSATERNVEYNNPNINSNRT